MLNYKSPGVVANVVFWFFTLIIFFSIFNSINELELEGRKLIALVLGIPFLLLINYLLVVSVEKAMLALLVLYPIWQRPAYYLKLMYMPDGFYILSLQQFYFIILSIILFLLFIMRRNKSINKNEMISLLFLLVVLIFSSINYFFTNQTSNIYNLNIYIVNYMIPVFLFFSLILYTSGFKDYSIIDRIIKYFVIFQLFFCMVEVVFRGGAILSNPYLLIKYGLRVPSGSDGSQIITGGIRDLLYFAWLFSWLPIYFYYKYNKSEITKREYIFFMGFSYCIVFLTYSKSPIVILLLNTLLLFKINGVLNRKSIIKIFIFLLAIAIISPLFINKFIVRVIQFYESVSAFFSVSDSASRTIDMTVYYRLRAIIDQVEFIFSDVNNFIIGGYSNFVEGSSIFLVFSVFGFIALIIIFILSLLYFISCNIYQKGIFLSFLLYSITSLESFVGVSNYKIFIQSINIQDYIERYGWYPQYSMGNVFVTIVLFVFVQKSLEIKP